MPYGLASAANSADFTTSSAREVFDLLHWPAFPENRRAGLVAYPRAALYSPAVNRVAPDPAAMLPGLDHGRIDLETNTPENE